MSKAGEKHVDLLKLEFHNENVLCAICKESLNSYKIQNLSKSNGFTYPPYPNHLPELNCIGNYLVSSRLPFMQIRRFRHEFDSKGIIGQVINIPVDVNNMENQLPRQLDDDYAINGHIKRHLVHKSSYLTGLNMEDFGVVELKKGDVAMIFYITVMNVGSEPVPLLVNSTKCCNKITKEDEDCESMKLFGGDMGQLFPQDTRNLTLIYANLYLHNRVGACDVQISDSKGGEVTRSVNFNTTLVKGEKVHVPRLLEQFYDPDDVMACENVDDDPLNACKPYICDIRYDGVRSFYNYTTKRCEKVPKCTSEPPREEQLVAYDIETGTCKTLITTMTEKDFADFKEGKPSIHTLSHEHGYPINVRCHNGKIDKKGHWCECNEGWSSAPFDHKYFNPDIQVYHMCTVWMGELNAVEAKNITVLPKSQYKKTNIIIFSILGVSFLLLLPLFGYLMYKLRLGRKVQKADDLDQSEMALLSEGEST